MQNCYPSAYTASLVKPKEKKINKLSKKILNSPLFGELKEQFPDLPHCDIAICIETCQYDKARCIEHLTGVHQLMQAVNDEMNENSDKEPSFVYISPLTPPLTIDTSGPAGIPTVHRPNALIPAGHANQQQTQLLFAGSPKGMNEPSPCYSPTGAHLHISEVMQRIQQIRAAYNPNHRDQGTVRLQCEQMEKLMKELENECIRLRTLRQELDVLERKFATKSLEACDLSLPMPDEIQRISRENTKLHSEIAGMQEEIDNSQPARPAPVPYPMGFVPFAYPQPQDGKLQSPPLTQQPQSNLPQQWRPTRPPPPPPTQPSQWECQRCTLHNPPDAYLCKACDLPRPQDMSPNTRGVPCPPGQPEQWDVNPAYTGRRT